MFKRIFRLIKIARNLSTSGAVDTINQVYNLPLPINLFFSFLSIGSPMKPLDNQKSSGAKLCTALQGMGTTFIKLGQFLATRPDIIGEEMATNLEKLQDKVPAFDIYEAKKIIKKEIGEKQFNNIIEISEPIAAASIAQVHMAKIKNENQENKIDVNTMAKKQTAVIADIVQTYVDGPKYNVLDGGGGLSSISDFRQLGNFGTKEDGTAVTYDEWKTDQINAMVGGVNDTKNQKAGQVLYNSGKYFYASSLSQFETLHPDVDVKYWLNSSNATGVPITTLNAEQMKAARGLADTAIESQVKHIEKVAAAAKSGQQERPLSQANINKDKDDAMLIGFMDGVNSLVSDDASKFDAEANDRIVALNKGQTDPARRIDSIVRDDDEILITYQNGKVEPVNRLDDNGNPKSARVISQELWRFVTDQSDDSFKYAADIYAKEQGGGFRSTTRESTAEEDKSFIANERAIEKIGPAPVLVELEGKPTNFEINKNAETFKKETDAYALKLKDEIELQGGKVTAEELDTMKRLILTGGDASKYASLAPFAEVTASSQQTMIQGTGKGATMVTPTEYLKDKFQIIL